MIHTKKELRRFPKKDLLRIAKSHNMPCNTKTSKNELVECIFKHKQARESLEAPAKRKMTQKQLDALKKHGFKGKPTAGNKTEPINPSLEQDISETNKGKQISETAPKMKAPIQAKVPKFLSGGEQVVDFKTGETVEKKEAKLLTTKIDKTTRDEASFEATKLKQGLGGAQSDAAPMPEVDSHTQRLLNNINERNSMLGVRNQEYLNSLNKSTDAFDRKLFDRVTRKNKKELIKVYEKATRNQDAPEYDQLALDDDSNLDGASELQKISTLISLNAKFKAGVISEQDYNRELQKFQQLDIEETKGIARSRALVLLNQRLDEQEKRKLQEALAAKERTKKLLLFKELRDAVKEKNIGKQTEDLVNQVIADSLREVSQEEEKKKA